MVEACTALNTPVVSGNVSFYNETEGRGILPTPVIGMIGLVEDVRRAVQPGFKKPGDLIALLGETEEDLLNSEYAVRVLGRTTQEIVDSGTAPRVEFSRELAVQRTCLQAAEAGLLHSAHDSSDGGLGVSLAESCFSSLGTQAVGADVDLGAAHSAVCLLFSESPSRILVSFDPSNLHAVQQLAEEHACPFTVLGQVGGTRLLIKSHGKQVISEEVAELEKTWRESLSRTLAAEAMVASME
jgi:phosphoribosylformylglycinamidine synthase